MVLILPFQHTRGSTAIEEVILAPNANYGETALVPTTLNELNNPANLNFNLNDNTSPVTGNVSWAFQWDDNLNPGDEEDISKDKGLKVIDWFRNRPAWLSSLWALEHWDSRDAVSESDGRYLA